MPMFSDIVGGYTAEDLLPGIGYEESRLNPKTRYGPYIPKLHERAIGEYQVLPETARRFGFSPNDMLDPVKNREAAKRYVDWLLQHYHGDPYKTVEAYHTGETNVDRGTIPQITRGYASDVARYPATQAAMRRVRESGSGLLPPSHVEGPGMTASSAAGPMPAGPTDPFAGDLATIQKEIDELNAPAGEKAPTQPEGPRTTQLPFMFYRAGAGDTRGDITQVPHIYDPVANLKQLWQDIKPTMQRGYEQVQPYLSKIGPSVNQMFQEAKSYLPQSKVTAIQPDPGETIS